MATTKAWLRVQKDIERYAHNPIEAPRVPAIGANPQDEVKTVATAKQRAAARRNIKKAQAARRKKGKTKTRRKRRSSRKKKATGFAAAHRSIVASRKKTVRRKRRKKRAAPRRRKATRRRRAVRTQVERVVRVPKARTQVVRVELASKRSAPSKRRRKKSTRRRRRNPVQPPSALLHNPGYENGMLDGLLSNPDGPFSKTSLTGYFIAAGGVSAGLVIADFVDRFVATRTPSESAPTKAEGKNPWMGRDAAAAQRRRPDAMRLGVQAGGAVGAMILTYLTRRGNILPWLFGGTSVGFGANLGKQLTDWWFMPTVFKVQAPTEVSFANRMFPMEQSSVQDEIDKIFENWAATTTLAEGQTDTPVIQSPLGGPGGPAYTLGKARSGQYPQPGTLTAQSRGQEFVRTGRLGKCETCGGYNGCWSGCEDYNCVPCNEGGSVGAQKCHYTVQPGDDFAALASAARIDISMVNGLNGGGDHTSYWKLGNKVTLPFALCRHIEKRGVVSGPPSKESAVSGTVLSGVKTDPNDPEIRLHSLLSGDDDNAE